jgi:hypothetical protein
LYHRKKSHCLVDAGFADADRQEQFSIGGASEVTSEFIPSTAEISPQYF